MVLTMDPGALKSELGGEARRLGGYAESRRDFWLQRGRNVGRVGMPGAVGRADCERGSKKSGKHECERRQA